MQPTSRTDPYLPFLVTLWLLQGIMVGLLVWLNPNHYITIDSEYYLSAAQNILEGYGYKVAQHGPLEWNSTFPIGYSLSISYLAFITGLPVLWASKLLNMLASAILLFYLRRWFGSYRTIMLGSLLLTGPFLKLWAHTWSEPLFIMVLFLWCRMYMNVMTKPAWLNTSGVLLLGMILISIRYAGIFILIPAIVQMVHGYCRGSSKRIGLSLLMFSGWLLFLLTYLTLNQNQSGNYYGGERFFLNLSPGPILKMWTTGLLKQWFGVPSHYPHLLRYFILFLKVIQIILCGLLWYEIRRDWQMPKQNTQVWAKHFATTGFHYLLFLFILRFLSPFDNPGYRLLAPFWILILGGLLLILSDQRLRMHVKILGVVLLLTSWISLLPSSLTAIKLPAIEAISSPLTKRVYILP